MSLISNGRFERTITRTGWCARGATRGMLVALVLGLVAAGPAVAPVAAQSGRGVDALVGSSFANIGTTLVASGSARVPLNDFVSIVGEIGVLPRAPFDRAEEIRMPVPTLVSDADRRVNGYHFNANAQLNLFGRDHPFGRERWIPYVTVGIGSFVADTVATGTMGESHVRTRRRETNLATNVGGGVTYRLTEWMGLNGEYRTFYIHRDDTTPRVHRLTAGISLLVWR